ncbi:hypothetical protein HBI24_049640 [Parastagonospora nodorum]|nr:hypothetical protein HBH53_091180 [Parastagonospora nodorum]KAH4169947.1 hypothetical protein HBH43_112880 [Parastagonospora nodorum]KAH5076768.1 hypothetical protein HBH95_117650 [Parastagonospora nodorum]KAH5155212.1 hypothetical protein HBH69_111230 [Parastagonospora nodorum]KAH5213239.1 hypothetical protein HBH77_070650 [Parastagonospora nodorum]
MATYVFPITHSPQMSDGLPQPTLAHSPPPFTPVHSPHHSVNSSVSSRTPIHTLSIREYRKQQHTPNPHIETPSGKTLRRKAAAPTLNTAKPKSSVQTARPQSQSTSRPLHLSHSAHQLNISHRSPFEQQLLANHLGRAQSAEPRTQGGSISSISTTTSSGKVGHFKSRKRLPKPPTVTNLAPLSSHLAPTRSILRHPRISTALDVSADHSHADETPTTHTTSTFSLSRFPQPPHLEDPSFSHSHHNNEHTRIATLSHTSTAPATPPATPATIHYRGASFDLVNPHDSLLLHDIVTPSKDFGSSEYFLIPTSEEPFPDISDMAPKRALYGDFTAAHAGIMRRAEDSFSSSNLDLPLPPTPAAISPDSSAYTSPIYSPDSNFAPPPLAVAKAPNESRFSLRQLTRTLTKRLGKSPEKQQIGRELQELQKLPTSLVSMSVHGEYPRPLQETYVTTPQSAYFPLGPTSPVTPTSPDEPFEHEDIEVELSRRHPFQRYDSEPMASLIPDDDYSTQAGRVDDPRTSMSGGYLVSKPYYDDIESIYASSSIYTSDDRRRSNYQQSLGGTRQSNPFLRYSGVDASSFANEDNPEGLYVYSSRSNRKSQPLSQDMYRRMAMQEKTDTISKIIDQYDPNVITNNTPSMVSEARNTEHGFSASEPYPLDELTTSDHEQCSKATSGLSQFTFGMTEDQSVEQGRGVGSHLNQQSTLARDAGLSPRVPAPLAPPFHFAGDSYRMPHPESSAMFSNQSYNSYGDTRNLLGISQTDGLGLSVSSQLLPTSSSYSEAAVKSLKPSSSYSQPASPAGPPTPQEALDQADQIFQNASNEQKQAEKGIPAMWVRRSSGSLLLAKQNSVPTLENRLSSGSGAATAGLTAPRASNDGDWESVAGNSQPCRDSCGSAAEYGSIADYSSSEGTRNSLGLNSDGSLPSWVGQNHSQGVSIYSHPSPIRAHHNPFSSSPPQLRPQGWIEPSSPPLGSSPPAATTVPGFRFSTHSEDIVSLEATEQPYALAPWANGYTFSDKKTLELLASGPNDKIMVETERVGVYRNDYDQTCEEGLGVMAMTSSPVSIFDGPNTFERENTFEKLCVIGPKGNLTGTPRGTGMHETGSSVADTSSPGQMTPGTARAYPGFYASPFPATGSVTTIQQSPWPVEPGYEPTPSQMTLYPRPTGLEPVAETSPDPGAKRRESIRSSTSLQKSQRRVSRSNVPGQTKLRQMVLAPGTARKTLSSADTRFSQYMGSERPSTSDTTTPLSPGPQVSIGTLPIVRTLIAHQHSPHLLSVEKDLGREDEERRHKLSWVILAVFCILPPCMFLYRVYGDRIMTSLTKGDVGTCTSKSKRVAFIGGIAVNTGLITAIVVPIIVLHALGAAS